MSSAYAAPLLITAEGSAEALKRLPLSGPESSAAYSESWLQDLLFRFPSVLPIAEIDDSFSDLIPICREMNTPAGPVDVLYVTPNGRPVVVEAKLWRNPEARRKVVGQVLDYAKELGRFNFDSLDAAVRAVRRSMEREEPPRGLVDLVKAKVPDLDEARFCDSLIRNLRRGDMLLLIVGDGIREGVGAIADFLESHGTLHFSFGLVELAVYQMPKGARLVQPRILAQSEIIRRVIVELIDGSMTVREEAAAEAEAEGEAEEAVSEELLRARERFSRFWATFLGRLQLDDKSQPINPPTISTNQSFLMPRGSNAWVSAYLTQSKGRAGVYLRIAKGPIGDRIYAALEAKRDEVGEALGVPVQWESDGAAHRVTASRAFPGDLTDMQRADVNNWLADHVNRFVTAFRQRIETLVRDN